MVVMSRRRGEPGIAMGGWALVVEPEEGEGATMGCGRRDWLQRMVEQLSWLSASR